MADAEEEEEEGSEAEGEAKTPRETSVTKVEVIEVGTTAGAEAAKDARRLEVAVAKTIVNKDKLSTAMEILEIVRIEEGLASPTSVHEAVSQVATKAEAIINPVMKAIKVDSSTSPVANS